MIKKPIIFTRKHSISVLILIVFMLFLQSFSEIFLILIVFTCYLVTTLLLMDVWIVYGVTKKDIDKALAKAGDESHSNYDIVPNTVTVASGIPGIQYYSVKNVAIIIFHLPVKSPKIRFIKRFRKILENSFSS